MKKLLQVLIRPSAVRTHASARSSPVWGWAGQGGAGGGGGRGGAGGKTHFSHF